MFLVSATFSSYAFCTQQWKDLQDAANKASCLLNTLQFLSLPNLLTCLLSSILPKFGFFNVTRYCTADVKSTYGTQLNQSMVRSIVLICTAVP